MEWGVDLVMLCVIVEEVGELGVMWVLVWLGLSDEWVWGDVVELCELLVVWCDVKRLVWKVVVVWVVWLVVVLMLVGFVVWLGF